MTNEKDEFSGAKEVESNWFKFNNIGDAVKGTLIAKNFQKGTEPFPDQYIYELRKADGEIVNVGISVKKSGTVQRLNSCKLGQIIGIKFESQTEAKQKGFAATKNLKVYDFGMDSSFELFAESPKAETEDALSDVKFA